MFAPVDDKPDFPQLEQEVLEYWKQHSIYEQSLQRRADAPRFVFYEGPPTANGLPHPGHCLTRAIKDLFPRYRTMRGYLCERKGGWDTHGLPVEVEVCKELGIHAKEEIESYGVEPFIQLCQQSVWRYMQQWERLTERLGFWIRLEDAYVTYHQQFVESVWWSLKTLFDRGLLYQGHKIVWWWAQGGTALSAGEVGQGYREVADPSVYVRFPLVDAPDTALVVWTTTPWTLPSNQFAAVHPELEYATVVDEESGERLIMAADLVGTVADKVKRSYREESRCLGETLLGRRYVPPFDYYYGEFGQQTGRRKTDGEAVSVAWRVVAADFVTTASGSGVVHQAPAFGEEDFEVLLRERETFVEGEGPELICAVGPDGKFTERAGPYQGRWVKEADKDITRELKQRGLLVHQEQYLHEYPFCWRADQDPLIQYPRESWFVRTTQFRDQMLANNRQINWLPGHIRDGRFGNFLESNVDWALSRERFWGTPLPIWVCEQTGKMEAVASYAELLGKPDCQGSEVWEAAKAQRPELPDDLRVHKPYIDAVHYASPHAPGARMRRVPEVIDCWYDSGAMPFAQWGFPHQGREDWQSQFPADFISEALDQTRGWFYSLLAISTLLAADDGENPLLEEATPTQLPAQDYPHPFRNCIVLGLMLAESFVCTKCGQRHLNSVKQCDACGNSKLNRKVEKMSKKLRNYREPQEIFDVHGADALRWYFFANQPPWNSILYSERAIKESSAGYRLTLWNVYKFFVVYANINGFSPKWDAPGQLDPATLAAADDYRPCRQRGELDRWILSELHRTNARVIERMDAYDNYSAATALASFLELLSNWWLRRSRDRFWREETPAAERADAHWTLYECLLTLAKMTSPFTPFLSEMIWRNLTASVAAAGGTPALASVHLCDFPDPNAEVIDQQLSGRMELLRQIASLGRSARTEASLKIRQPLAQVDVILADATHQPWLAAHEELLCHELNVKRIVFAEQADEFISYQVQPNFKRLGPRVGKLMPKLKAALQTADGGHLLAQLASHGKVSLTLDDQVIELDEEDIQVGLQAKEGWAAAQGEGCVVVLSTELSPELIAEGWAKDVNRRLQDQRKEMQCEFTDRLRLAFHTDDAQLQQALETWESWLRGELLAVELAFLAAAEAAQRPGAIALEVEGRPLTAWIEVVASDPSA